jgi:hypothetical protein
MSELSLKLLEEEWLLKLAEVMLTLLPGLATDGWSDDSGSAVDKASNLFPVSGKLVYESRREGE